PASQPGRQPGDRDHPRAARRARRRREEQEALQRLRADGPRVRYASTPRYRHGQPRRHKHDDVRAVRRLRGDEPRLPGGGRGRRCRLDGRGRHARVRAEADRSRPRLAAHQRRDPPGARARFLRETDMRRLPVVLVVAVVAAGAAAGAPSWAQKGPIKVGLLVPQTGPLAANGKDMINGFELFFEEHKYRLAGREIKFIVEDDEGKPATGITKARGLVEGQGVHLLTGPLSAAVGYAVSPYIESRKIPAIYPTVSGADALRFGKQFAEAGLKEKLPLIGGGTFTDEHVLRVQGDEVLGVVTALHYSAALGTPANKKFAAAYEAKFKQAPSYYSEGTYVAGIALKAALEATGGDIENVDRFLGALRRVDLSDAPRGPMKFDDFGNPIQNVYVRRVEKVNGRLQNTVVHTFPSV